MSDDLLARTEGGVHYLTLNRPKRRNALTPGLARTLAQQIERLEESSDVQVVVITGAGGHFCAGLDLHWLQELGAMPAVPDLQRGLSDFQSAILAIVGCPIPVVAVLEGTIAGFGFDLALACDLRVAAQSAAFTSAFARMGLVPDGGSTFTLPRLIGLGGALRFLMTSETVDADTALRIGLIEEIVKDEALGDHVRRLVERLRENDPGSLRAIKRLTRGAELGALEQALAAEGAFQLKALQRPEFRQRLAAFTARTSAHP